ncbi:hypothetical protein EPN16_07760, partial [bacterium]
MLAYIYRNKLVTMPQIRGGILAGIPGRRLIESGMANLDQKEIQHILNHPLIKSPPSSEQKQEIRYILDKLAYSDEEIGAILSFLAEIREAQDKKCPKIEKGASSSPAEIGAGHWWLEKKSQGILWPLFSMRREDELGTGDLWGLKKVIDYLALKDMDMVFLLPTNQTTADNPCSYCGISLFANDAILYLPLDVLMGSDKIRRYLESGNLIRRAIEAQSAERIDYPSVFAIKEHLLWAEFHNEVYPQKILAGEVNLDDYLEEYAYRIKDYSLFHALSGIFKGKPWWEWPAEYRDRSSLALRDFEREYHEKISFYQWLQWLYYQSWVAIKQHAEINEKRIIGDLPMYPSANSAETWSLRDLFDMEKYAGAPADAFSPEGQIWDGHPYRWHEQYGGVLELWQERLRYAAKFFHGVRIDNLFGFNSQWIIERGKKAAEGEFYPGSEDEMAVLGRGIITSLAQTALEEGIVLIGEDLGIRPAKVIRMLDGLSERLPNLFLYNAVGWREKEMARRPHTLIIEATHDTPPTFSARWPELSPNDKNQVRGLLHDYGYVIDEGEPPESIANKVISVMRRCENLFSSLTIQTILGAGPDSRINTPNTVGPHNWTWRPSLTLEELIQKESASSPVAERPKITRAPNGELMNLEHYYIKDNSIATFDIISGEQIIFSLGEYPIRDRFGRQTFNLLTARITCQDSDEEKIRVSLHKAFRYVFASLVRNNGRQEPLNKYSLFDMYRGDKVIAYPKNLPSGNNAGLIEVTFDRIAGGEKIRFT